jgi:hypothetical protein
MAREPGAARLYEKVAFDKRVPGNPDSPPVDYGNTEGEWEEQFQRRAEFIHLRGGESVLAARMQGQHTQVIRVRAGEETRSVNTDWRIRDLRTGAEFNIRDITPSDDRAWLDILAVRGVTV